jgi:hypothetical protein
MTHASQPAPNEAAREAELAKAILVYLAGHPDAMDTVEGIAGWWLLRQRVETEVYRVAGALCALARRGLLEEVGTGPSRRYRLRRAAPGGAAAGGSPLS